MSQTNSYWLWWNICPIATNPKTLRFGGSGFHGFKASGVLAPSTLTVNPKPGKPETLSFRSFGLLCRSQQRRECHIACHLEEHEADKANGVDAPGASKERGPRNAMVRECPGGPLLDGKTVLSDRSTR